MLSKDIFIIHTKSDPIHRSLVREVSERLGKVGVGVWGYSDWRWASPDIERFSDELEPFLSDIDKVIYSDLQEIERGDVEREQLRRIVLTTPAVIAFDLEDKKVTDGIEEEVKILDDWKYKGILIGVIRPSGTGFFTRRYPYFISSVFALEDVSQDDDEGVLSLQRLSLFAFRILIIGQRRRALLAGKIGRDQLGILRNLWEKSLALIESCSFDLQIFHDLEISRIYDELLCFARDLIVDVGEASFQKELTKMTEWILNEFGGYCRFKDLSRAGFEALLDILQLLEHEPNGAIARIIETPMYRERVRQYVISQDAVSWGLKLSASLAGQSVVDTIIETIDSTKTRGDSIENLVNAMGLLSKDFDEETRARALSFLTSLFNEDPPAQEKEACIRAAGKIGTTEAELWLQELFERDFEEATRLAVVLALMYSSGRKACPLVLEFLADASSRSRIIIASASWRVDTDELYDALLRCETSQPDRLSANLLHSWNRVQNPQTYKALLQALSSESMYLRGVAAVSARDYLERNPPENERREIINGLRSAISNLEEVAKYAAISVLLGAGEKDYQKIAILALKNLLAEGKIEMANVLLEAGGVGFNDWPDESTTRMLLFHPSPKIRQTMVYIVGSQSRKEFVTDLSRLENDVATVFPLHKENPTVEIRGRTVAETARIAKKRITDVW